MTLTTFASGTQTCTVTTEHELASINVVGEFSFALDFFNAAQGDDFEIRVYKKLLTGGTERLMFFEGASGLRTDDLTIALFNLWIPNDITDSGSLRITLKQTVGTSRNIPYKIYKRDNGADIVTWLGVAPNALVAGRVNSFEHLFTATASAGGNNTITLAGGVATDNYYRYATVQILSGTGAGQTPRIIMDYVGSTKVATVSRQWSTNPDSTSIFAVLPFTEPMYVISGIAQAGAGSTITLQSNASVTDNIYRGALLHITSGLGIGQTRIILSYVGSTKVATVDDAWLINPDSTSVYEVIKLGRSFADVYEWNGAAVATPDASGYPVVTIKSGTGTGELSLSAGVISADVTKLNGSVTAAAAFALQVLAGQPATATGTPTTTTMRASGLASTHDDQYGGDGTGSNRSIFWTSGALKGVVREITDYTDSTREFTFAAVHTAPTAGDTFVIL